jgi:hypothetical protein
MPLWARGFAQTASRVAGRVNPPAAAVQPPAGFLHLVDVAAPAPVLAASLQPLGERVGVATNPMPIEELDGAEDLPTAAAEVHALPLSAASSRRRNSVGGISTNGGSGSEGSSREAAVRTVPRPALPRAGAVLASLRFMDLRECRCDQSPLGVERVAVPLQLRQPRTVAPDRLAVAALPLPPLAGANLVDKPGGGYQPELVVVGAQLPLSLGGYFTGRHLVGRFDCKDMRSENRSAIG